MYIYICIYICVCIYVYMYIYTVYIEATGKADENYQGGRGRGGESRGCPKTIVSTSGGKLDDSGLLFLLT